MSVSLQKSELLIPEAAFPHLARIARESGADYATLANAGVALGVDSGFQLWELLFIFLSEHSDFILKNEFIDEDVWVRLKANIDIALPSIESGFSGPSQHPLKGFFSNYPALSLILQPLKEDSQTIDKIKAIVICLLLLEKTYPSERNWNTSVSKIRVALSELEAIRNYRVFDQIFDISTSLTGIQLLFALVRNINTQLEKPQRAPKEAITHFRKICTVLISKLQLSKIKTKPLPIVPLDDEGKPITGLGSIELLIDESDYGGDTDIEGIRFSEPLSKEGDPISSEGFHAEGNQSRFWIDQLHDPVYFAPSALNDLEIETVEKELISTAESDPLACLIILLIYTTSASAETVQNYVFGTDILADSRFCRIVKRASDSQVRTSENYNWLEQSNEEYEILLPPIIVILLQQLLPNGVSNERLGNLFDIKFTEICRKWIQKIRSRGYPRITEYRLKHTLKNRLACRTKDLALTWQLFGTEDDSAPIEAFYCAFSTSRLADEYSISLREILPNLAPIKPLHHKNDAEYCGTLTVPVEAKLRNFTQQLANQVRRELGNSENDYIDSHNLLVSYTAFLLMSTTGHRPVDDVFPNISWVYESLGMVMIEDKVVDEQRRKRLASLSKVACQQITAYRKHLVGLTNQIHSEKKDHATLISSIIDLVESPPRQNQFPFLFILKHRKGRLIANHLTITDLQSRIKKLQSFPLRDNWARHHLAVVLRECKQRAPMIAAQLGHFQGMPHIYGCTSPRIPSQEIASTSFALDILTKKQGWQAIENSQFQLKGRSYFINKYLLSPRLLLEPATEKRAKRRKKNRVEDADVIKLLLRDQFSDTLPKKISSTDYDQLLQELRIRCNDQPRRYALRAMALWRFLRRKITAGHDIDLPSRFMMISPESMPFPDIFLVNLRQSIEAREQFVQYLSRGVEGNENLDITTHLSEVIVASSLFGGLLSPDHLKNLPLTLKTSAYKVGQYLIFDFQEKDRLFRWIASSLPLHLICRKPPTTLKSVNSNDILDKVNSILIKIDPIKNTGDPFKRLSELSKSFWQYSMPGFVFSAISGKSAYTPLPEKSFIRMATGKRLLLDVDKTIENTWIKEEKIFARSFSGNLKEGQEFVKLLNKINTEVTNLPAKGSNLRKENKKRIFKQKIRLELARKSWPSTVACIAAWAIHLSDHGTRYKKNISYRTVYEYVSIISKPLIELAGNLDFISLASLQYEDLYISAVYYKKSHNRRSYIANRLVEFHHYLHVTVGAESIDSTIFGSYLTRNNRPANANILLPNEYLSAIKILLSTEELSLRTRYFYSVMLILGYRFGLRFGEIFRLRFMDIQYDINLDKIVIQVKNSLYGETKSFAGIRQVPLLEKLTKREKEILLFFFDHAENRADEDKSAALFSQRENLRLQVDRSHAVEIITKALLEVTGEPSFRTHHLRRSWGCRIAAHIFIVNNSGRLFPLVEKLIFDADDSNQVVINLYGYNDASSESLRPLSIAIGHSSIETTISFYIHIVEIYAVSHIEYHNIPSASDHVAAYLLGKTEVAIRKQRERYKIAPYDLISVLKNYAPNLSQFPTSKVKVTNRKPRKLSVLTKKNHKFSLNDIEKILTINLIRRGDLGDLASIFMLSDKKVSGFLTAAEKAETRLGTGIYSVLEQSADFWHVEPTSTVNESSIDQLRKGNKRLMLYLFHLESCIDKWESEKFLILEEGLKVWQSCHSQKIGLPLFADLNQAKSYILVLNLIGIPTENITAKIPDKIEQEIEDKLIKKLNSLKITSVLEARLSMIHLSNGKKVVPVALTLKRRTHPIAYENTLQRVLFVMATWLNIRENIDP